MKVTELFEDRYFNQWAKEKAAENRVRNKLTARKAPRPAQPPKSTIDLFKVWSTLQTVVSNVVPDGDPIDTLPGKLLRLGVPEDKIMSTLDAAVKKYHDSKSDYHKYLADMWDTFNELAAADDKRDNPWK